MRRRGGIFPVFSVFLAAALLIFVFSQKGMLKGPTGLAESLMLPLKKIMYQSVTGFGKDDSSEIAKLRRENSKLVSEFVKEKELERETQAFGDQFENTPPAPSNLL